VRFISMIQSFGGQDGQARSTGKWRPAMIDGSGSARPGRKAHLLSRRTNACYDLRRTGDYYHFPQCRQAFALHRSAAPGRPKPLTHPLGGQRTTLSGEAWGQLPFRFRMNLRGDAPGPGPPCG